MRVCTPAYVNRELCWYGTLPGATLHVAVEHAPGCKHFPAWCPTTDVVSISLQSC